MNGKQMLSDFEKNFTEFRESFHNVMNNVMAYEMSSDLGSRKEQSTNRLAELDNLIEEKRNEIANSTLTGEELEALKQRNEALITGYNQEKEVISNDQKEFDKEYEQDVKAYREELKNSINKLRESFGAQIVGGREISKIDLLRETIKNQITSYDYQLVTLKAELDKSKDSEEIKRIANEMRKIRDKKIQRENFLGKLGEFEKSFASLESKYIKGNKFVDVFDLEKYSSIFDEMKDAIEGTVENTLISFNVITNTDGTYSLDMRCGNKIGEPRPIIDADKLTQETINRYLKGFVGVVASKTDLTAEELMNGQVIVKKDGVTLGREDFKNVGSVVESKIKGNEPQVDEPQVDEPQVDEPQVDEPQVDEPQVDEPQVDEPQNDGPQVDEPQNDGPQNDAPQNDAPQNNNDIDPVLNRCFQVRAARESRFKKVKDGLTTVGTVAAVGLGLLVGPEALMFAGLGAAAAVAGVNIVEKAGNVMDKLRQASVKHKLKKTAKKFGLKVDYDYDNRTIKFFAQDGNDKVIMTSLHDSASDIQQELDKQFKYINSPKENSGFENFPRVTLDNLEASFVEFGGLQTKKEREELELQQNTNGWRFLTDNILRRNSRALGEERANAEEVDLAEVQEVDVENLEQPVAPINGPEDIEAEVVDGHVVEAEQMAEAMENAEPLENETPQVEEVTPEVADVVNDYEAMFDDLDNAELDVNGVNAPSDEEIVTALTNNSLDKQTAIDYITQAEDLNNDLVIEMVESGVITQDEIDAIWETRENNQARGLV